MPRSRLTELDGSGLEARSGELLVVLVWLVAGDLGIDESDLNAARRRAMFVLAAGGDPHRELDHDSVAAERLATELDTPERRLALAEALGGARRRGGRPPDRDGGPRPPPRRAGSRLAKPRARAPRGRARRGIDAPTLRVPQL